MREFFRLLNRPCADIAALVSAAMDTDLPRSQRWAMRIHLLYCRACRAYRRQAQMLRKMMRTAAEAEAAEVGSSTAALSPEARQRIKQAIINH